MHGALIIGLLGAESTGKSTLARALAEALAARGHDAVQVPEYLREFCDVVHRTPLAQEQRHILQEQTRRIAEAAAAHAIVVADTTALMTAAYSAEVFGDSGLNAQARSDHRHCALTLLCGLDLPWQADATGQRDGPQSRGPMDSCLRALLQDGSIPYAVLLGSAQVRLHTALVLVQRLLATAAQDGPRAPRWQGACERCGDAGCEAQLLRLLPR